MRIFKIRKRFSFTLTSTAFLVVLILIFIQGSDLKNSFSLLHEAEVTMKKLITQKFDEAVRMSDRASIERYHIHCLFNHFNNFFGIRILNAHEKQVVEGLDGVT